MFTFFVILMLELIFVASCGPSKKVDPQKTAKNPPSESTDNKIPDATMPYYFLVVHNEPDSNAAWLEKSLTALDKIIARADQHSMKITLMFGVTWVDFMNDTQHPERKQKLTQWKSKGHEIAIHHHSVYHPYGWDGYTVLSQQDAIVEREKYPNRSSGEPASIVGDMNVFANKFQFLDADMKSGCMNEEMSKKHLPKNIIYLTCSGFANNGVPGTFQPTDL